MSGTADLPDEIIERDYADAIEAATDTFPKLVGLHDAILSGAPERDDYEQAAFCVIRAALPHIRAHERQRIADEVRSLRGQFSKYSPVERRILRGINVSIMTIESGAARVAREGDQP